MVSAVFLDRDGTINVEKEYIHRSDQFEFEDGAIQAIAKLNQAGFKVIVVTNQAGIARGYYAENDVDNLHRWVNGQLDNYGAHIDDFYYCPHHPQYGIGEFKKECNCRKPNTGLIEQAIMKHRVDINRSFMIGDKECDILAGISAGLNSILVLTGYGRKTVDKIKYQDVSIANDLYEAVIKFIL